jgi:7-carboxy-7-deazaguanine synthase
MQINTQPIERVIKDETNELDVHSIWETIQGEGPFAGTPAVFIRLAGCNLQCPLCDTDYTSERMQMSAVDIVKQVEHIRDPMIYGRRTLVVITGGEPLRQSIGVLCATLLACEYKVQIETNGLLYRGDLPFGDPNFAIVCSPKTPKLNYQLLPHITALKYVLAADCADPEDGLPTAVLGQKIAVARPWPNFTGDIYLQPEDHQDPYQNHRNVQAAVASCLKYGYRLCLQTHKIVGLP